MSLDQFLISLAQDFGYLGIFISVFLGTATIFLPVPTFLIVFGAGSVFHPALVGVIAGVAAALGELVTYGVGYGIEKKTKIGANEKWKKISLQTKKWFETYGGFAVIFVFAVTPLPDDVIGLLAGVLRYDIKKYFLATLLGKLVLFLVIAYSGFYGTSHIIDAIRNLPWVSL